jgi:surface carbohydrate biosynthesis protein
MSKLKVIIPVETKAREFHGKLFLALHLLRAGHPVLIGEQGRLWNYSDLVEPGIYLDKSVAATRADWFKRCRAMGHEVVSWDEEGLVFFDNWLYRKQRIEPKSFDQVSRFFAWGAVQREAICEEYPQYREKITLCGNPRFDFLRPALRVFYGSAVEILKQRFGRMILVNTNFAFHNHYKSPEEVRKILAKYPIANEPGYMDKWIAMHREMHEAYLAMVPELLARYPEHAVVVRPHPSESHAPWRELAKAHPRLHVDSSGNVHEWILASEAVIHFNCTTAVEAFLLDVPAIAYRPGRYPRYENQLPNALSENAFSLEALWAALDGRKTARERGVLWTEEQNRMAARYMTGLSGPTAAERICGEISALANGLAPKPFNAKQRCLAAAKRFWRLRLHALREARRSTDGYAAQKFPGMELAEIRETLARMMEVSGMKTEFSVRRFAKNCYWLLPKGGTP